MDKHFWLDRWQQRQIGFHQSGINTSLKKHWSALGLDSAAKVLVPLCGKSSDMLWLLEQGHSVTGVEISELAVKEFIAENSLSFQQRNQGDFESFMADKLILLLGDFFALGQELLGEVKCVYDRAALVALPPRMRVRYAQHLAVLLKPGSRILLLSMDYPQKEMSGPPFSVDSEEVSALFGGGFKIELLQSHDALAGNKRLAERGLTRMQEQVWMLTRR